MKWFKNKKFFKINSVFYLKGLKKDDKLMCSHVERDWILILIIFGVFALALLFFCTFLFLSCNQDLVIKPSSKDSSAYFVNQASMNEIINNFDEKKENFNKIKS